MFSFIVGTAVGIAITVLFPAVFNWGRTMIDKVTGSDKPKT